MDRASRIRLARIARRLSQGELARRLDVSQSAVARWEARATSRPSAPRTSLVAELARVLEVPVEWLEGGTRDVPLHLRALLDAHGSSEPPPSRQRSTAVDASRRSIPQAIAVMHSTLSGSGAAVHRIGCRTMAPTLETGDWVLCARAVCAPTNRGIFLIEERGAVFPARVSRVAPIEGMWTLTFDNVHEAERRVRTADIKLLGRILSRLLPL